MLLKGLIEREKNIYLDFATALKSRSSPICPTLLLSLGRPMMLSIPMRPPAMVARPVEDKAIPVSKKSVPVSLRVLVVLEPRFSLLSN